MAFVGSDASMSAHVVQSASELSAFIKGGVMRENAERDAGFCSGGDEDDNMSGLHSPSASEDSLEVQITPISLRNKRKLAEPRKIQETNMAPLKKRRFEQIDATDPIMSPIPTNNHHDDDDDDDDDEDDDYDDDDDDDDDDDHKIIRDQDEESSFSAGSHFRPWSTSEDDRSNTTRENNGSSSDKLENLMSFNSHREDADRKELSRRKRRRRNSRSITSRNNRLTQKIDTRWIQHSECNNNNNSSKRQEEEAVRRKYEARIEEEVLLRLQNRRNFEIEAETTTTTTTHQCSNPTVIVTTKSPVASSYPSSSFSSSSSSSFSSSSSSSTSSSSSSFSCSYSKASTNRSSINTNNKNSITADNRECRVKKDDDDKIKTESRDLIVVDGNKRLHQQEEPLALVLRGTEEIITNNNKASSSSRVPSHPAVNGSCYGPEEINSSANRVRRNSNNNRQPMETQQQQQQQRNYKNMTRERRIEANARERTRVHTISAAFETLRRAVPAYSNNQKLSKLSVLRIACSYIMTLSNIANSPEGESPTSPSLGACVDLVSRTIQTEGKLRKKKDE